MLDAEVYHRQAAWSALALVALVAAGLALAVVVRWPWLAGVAAVAGVASLFVRVHIARR